MSLQRALMLLLPATLLACAGDKDQQGDGDVDGSDDGGADDGGADAGDGQDSGGDDGDEGPVPTTVVVEAATSAEIGAWLPVRAVVLDADGAELPLAVTLSAEPLATFDPLEGVQFGADGVYVITGTLPAGDSWPELQGVSAPITVDSNGPLITLDAPLAATWPDAENSAWPTGGDLTVSGRVDDAVSAISGLTLNGDPVALAPDGSFSLSLPAGAGLQALVLEATDADGNVADRALGLARGPVHPASSPITPAVAVNLSEGGVLTLADQVSATVTEELVLSELVAANPLYSGSTRVSGLLVNIVVNATGVSWTSLTPGVRLSSGQLGVDLTVQDLEITTQQRVSVAGYTSTFPGSFSDTSSTISMDLELAALARGDVGVEATRSEVSFTSPAYDSGGYTIPASLGFDFEALVSPVVGPLIADYTVAVLEEQLESIVLDAPLDLLGAPLDFHGELDEVRVEPAGIALRFDGELIGGVVDPAVPSAPGSLHSPGAAPEPADSAADLAFALSPALINRVIHSAWQGGVFESTLSAESLGIEPALIELIFPGAETLDLTLSARLPAAMAASDGAFSFSLLELGLRCGGLRGGSDLPEEFVHASVHVQAPVEVSASATGSILAEIGEPSVLVDVLELSGAAVALDTVGAAEALEVRLASVAAAFVGDLIPDLDVFVPEVPGFTLTTEAVHAGGASGDWLLAECSL
ncbi:MAG: hypothetical protein JNM72_16160 [Deltaproteobacteria bacterium]|jgi:hypothetical protein|nr:hypothetical protein [Deltaproteobacteria bacterium]